MVPLAPSVLTALLVLSLHLNVALAGNASTPPIIEPTETTLTERGSVSTQNDANNLFRAVNGCPATTSFFSVEAAIFPASQEEEISAKSIGQVVQSCLALGRKNPAKALRLCAQLAAVSYMVLLGTSRTSLAREVSEKVNQKTKKDSTDSHKESRISTRAVPEGERPSVQNVLHRLGNGFTQILPFWAFAKSFTSKEQVSRAAQSPASSEVGLVEGLWNNWKFGPKRDSDSHWFTAEDESFTLGEPVNLSTLLCRNLAEFHAEGNACGVAKFAKTSFAAAHVSHTCSSVPPDTEGSPSFAQASADPIIRERSCREGTADGTTDLPLVPLQEYRTILSSLGDNSDRIPAQILQREGVIYSRLWEALDGLYQFHEKMRCSSDGRQLPRLLPGWTPELLVDVTEPHDTHQNPLCVFARRDKSLLIVIRGALTPAEWALTTEYELADFSPAYGKSIGKVSVGILKIYAAIWPALQTFLAISTTQQGLERIIVTGHSMGAAAGALISAALAASSLFDKDVDAVLFASPRPGDTRFMNFWKEQVNGRAVQFSLDVVTELPCLQMPTCEGKETAHLDLAALMAELSQVQRSEQANAKTKDSSNVYEYGDYPNAVVFPPSELPNALDQQSAHIRYNHFCAYACWLGTHFDSDRKKTMCKKRTGAHNAADDPSACPNL